MTFAFTVIELVCISLGAGAAFIFDSFFIMSKRFHKIKPFEAALLRRLSLFSIAGSSLALFLYMIVLALQFEIASDMRISLSLAKIIFLSLALLTGLALRKIHLNNLLRHQLNYGHLSEHMIAHPNPLIATAAYSTVSWMAVIFLTAIEYRQADIVFQFGFLHIIIFYIICGFLASKAAVFIKKNLV